MKENSCALVLGGYVNGYSIIQELSESGVKDIILFDTTRKVASYSNKIKKFVLIDSSPDSLLQELQTLHSEYSFIVLFPSEDLQLENLYALYEKISGYCFIPFNRENLLECLDKFNQYKYCEILGIPYPKTLEIRTPEDIAGISGFMYPCLIKPKKKPDKNLNIFKNLYLQNDQDLKKSETLLKELILKGVSFIVSEIIPGDGSNIYAYVGYRNKNGKILNEWTGKKLSQYPDDFGVFASASNSAPEEILVQGRTLLNGLDLKGIAEPEFKYDVRDGKYKLTEINLRSMMWNRVGNLSGVKIQYTQYLDATGGQVPAYRQEKTKDIHFVYLRHEIINLMARRGYYKTFFHNLFRGDKRYLALFDRTDLKPFIFSFKFF
jgi:predicted ATP-grasp superfamily ATP-dependent carboligase